MISPSSGLFIEDFRVGKATTWATRSHVRRYLFSNSRTKYVLLPLAFPARFDKNIPPLPDPPGGPDIDLKLRPKTPSTSTFHLTCVHVPPLGSPRSTTSILRPPADFWLRSTFALPSDERLDVVWFSGKECIFRFRGRIPPCARPVYRSLSLFPPSGRRTFTFSSVPLPSVLFWLLIGMAVLHTTTQIASFPC